MQPNLSKNPNYVHIDEIWKDHVRHEYQAWRAWPYKWGFVTREYIRMNRRLEGRPVSPDPEDAYFYANCDRTPPWSPARQISPLDQSDSSIGKAGAKLKRVSAYRNLPAILNGSKGPMATPSSIASSTTPEEVTPPSVENTRLPAIAKSKMTSSPGYPRTTAAMIGWNHGNKLETFGRAPNARGYQGILKSFNWPVQGIM